MPLQLQHRYSFNDGTMSDSIGGSQWDGTLHNKAQILNGSIVLSKTSVSHNFSTGSHARLPNGALGNSSSISLEMWVDIDQDNKDMFRLFHFGDPVNNCPSIYCRSQTGFLCCSRCSENGESLDDICTNQIFNGSKFHLIYSIDPAGLTTMYVNGETVASSSQSSPIFGRRPQDILLLGASPVFSDPTLWGIIHEFRIWSGAFGNSTARINFQIGPNHVNNRTLSSIPLLLSLPFLF